jgi:GNAT superfamily N-acetyltransferase
MAIAIRGVRAGDHEAWLALWRGYQQFYKADLSADEGRLWRDLLTARGDGPYALVAEVDGAILGLAQYLFHKTTWSAKPRCYLNDLFTHEAARGRGVGRALIEAVRKHANEAGCQQVWWLTQDNNAVARRLYDQVGKLTPFIKYVI